MSRHGIDYQTVKQTATKLLSQGIAPSVQKIREILGTGSNTTLAEHLKIWKEEYASKKIYQLPANMPKELIAAIELLWQTAMEQAQNQLSEYKKTLELEHEAMLNLNQEAKKTVAEFSKKITETSTKLEQELLAKQKLDLELALSNDRLEEQKNALSLQKEQYEERLKRIYEEKDQLITKSQLLQDQLKKLQEKLDLQTEEQQTLIVEQNKLHEQSENRWLKLIDHARQETKDSNKKLTETQSKYEIQLEKLKAKLLDFHLSANEKNVQLKLTFEQNTQLKEELEAAKKENITIKGRMVKFQEIRRLKRRACLIKTNKKSKIFN